MITVVDDRLYIVVHVVILMCKILNYCFLLCNFGYCVSIWLLNYHWSTHKLYDCEKHNNYWMNGWMEEVLPGKVNMISFLEQAIFYFIIILLI